MKDILIPTDFSENSWNAINYALELYEGHKCNFYLHHVNRINDIATGEMPYIPTSEIINDTILKKPKEKLQKLVKRIEGLGIDTNHHFITLVDYGFFIDAIKRQVQEKSIDLIIMGTKGASGMKEVVVGSNTGDVIKRVQCPVLIIPEKATYKIPREIAFPTDYNIFYKDNVVNTISKMLQLNKATLRILNISKKDEALTEYQKRNKEFLEDYFRYEQHSFHHLTCHKLENAVQCFVESREIDMITMIAKNLNLFQQILFHPTIEKISYHTEIPFLVLHE